MSHAAISDYAGNQSPLFLFSPQRAIRPFTQNEDDARKFGECAVRVVYYGLMWSVAMYLGEMEGFWPDVSQCWVQLRNG